MPTFSITCTNQLASRPNATRLENESFARSAILRDAQEEQREQRDADRDADEAQFLAHNREDEVGVLRGQERQPLLRPHREALAEPATGPDRDLRLDHVIAREPPIDVGVEEHQQSLLLVRLQLLPHERRNYAENDVRAPRGRSPRTCTACTRPRGPGAAGTTRPRYQVLNASSRLTPGLATSTSSGHDTPAQNSIANAKPTNTMPVPEVGLLHDQHPRNARPRARAARVRAASAAAP